MMLSLYFTSSLFYFVPQTFTKELCEKDSDGDGKTNGEELGDPGCVWIPSQGNLPEWASGVELSHPGKDGNKKRL